MHRIKLIVEYDGSNYHGFQRQDNAHTVQGAIEKGILKLIDKKITITSAGRTDTGVHALAQVVTFDTDSKIPPDKWQYALNNYLPYDIRIINSELTSSDFHPRYDAVSKIYNYKIYRHTKGTTFLRNYALCNTDTLDVEAMQKACTFLLGTHNFTSFCASGSTIRNLERNIIACHLDDSWPFLTLIIEANGFLRNMIRIIVGSLLEVGRKNIAPEKINDIIKAEDRRVAGPTAGPQGLYMMEVKF